MCSVRLVSATEQLRGEVLLIATTLLVVKVRNIYWNTIKMHKAMETGFSYQTAFRNSAPCQKDVY